MSVCKGNYAVYVKPKTPKRPSGKGLMFAYIIEYIGIYGLTWLRVLGKVRHNLYYIILILEVHDDRYAQQQKT